MTRRHRPCFVLWVAGQARNVCSCHYWEPAPLDRQLPERTRRRTA